MRILFLHQFNLNSGWGGSATYLAALHGASTRLGHQVRLASAQCPDRFGMTTSRLPFAETLTFGPEKRPGETTLDELGTAHLAGMAEGALAAIAEQEFAGVRPDLVIANHINLMARVAWRLAQTFGVPYRIVSYGTDTQLLVRDPRYRDLFGEAARGAERIWAISQFVAREIGATVGGRVEILGGAVDLERFHPEPTAPFALNRLVYSGRLVTEKGLWTLLEALALCPSAELELVGEGPLRKALESHLAGTALREQVRLTGYVDAHRLRKTLVAAGLAVVPSLWEEPLGLVVLEAMACGVPVIASAVGGIPEIVSDGVNGLLVPPGDARALAAAIDRATGDGALYRTLRRGVGQTVIPSYDDLARKAIS